MNFLLDGETSERLLFRKLQQSDFNAWLPFHQDPKTSQFWSGLAKDPNIACKNDFERTFFRYQNNLGGKMGLLSKNSTEILGLSGLLVQNVDGVKELEIAYSLLPKYWGKGYATEAAKKCKCFAKENMLAKSVISIIHIDNIPSQKVAVNNKMFLDKTTVYNNNPVQIYRALL